jgi:hypothetical protein
MYAMERSDFARYQKLVVVAVSCDRRSRGAFGATMQPKRGSDGTGWIRRTAGAGLRDRI